MLKERTDDGVQPDTRQLRRELALLRADNARLRTENQRLRSTLDELVATAGDLAPRHQPREMTAGTSVGPRRRREQ